MSRRRTRKRNHSVIAFIACGIALFFLLTAITIAQYIGWIIATAVIALAAYHIGRRSMPGMTALRTNSRYGKTRAVTTMNAVSGYPPGMLELVHAREEIRVLRASLADAIDALHAPHASDHSSDARAQLLNDPLSGAHPLIRKDDS